MKFPNFLSIIFEEISSVRKEEMRLRTSRKLYAQKNRTGSAQETSALRIAWQQTAQQSQAHPTPLLPTSTTKVKG